MADDIAVTTQIDLENLPMKHQVGKLAFSSMTAFVANHLADKAYDKALLAFRARRNK